MKRLSCILVVLLCCSAFCQNAEKNRDRSNLELQTTGHGFWKPRHPFGFRIYSTPDGTKVFVKYLTFDSFGQARRYIKTCLKSDAKVIYQRNLKDAAAETIDQRVIAVRVEPGEDQFALIRRIGLNCWFISASRLSDAIELEELIQARLEQGRPPNSE